jgi:putative DNA primase/helicase
VSENGAEHGKVVFERREAERRAAVAERLAELDNDATGHHRTNGRALQSHPQQVHRGQVRMAYRLAESYTGRLLHVTGLGWHSWDGSRWAHDERGEVKRAVFAELRRALADSLDDKELRADVRKCESAAGVAGVLDLAAALKPFAAAVADLDNDAHLLNVANGTLDLHTRQLRSHQPADRITKVCRGAYRPDAEAPIWTAFLARVLPDDEVRGFLQRLVGVGLLGTVREHVLGILTGVGANGKSVLDKAIRYSLGDYACTAEPDLFMHREGAHPTGEMDLRGVRWVVVSESDKDRRLAEATMKRLTGGDTIRARRMRQDFVEFTPSHTPLLITNHLPKVSGDDAAIWRRLRVVPFNVVIPEDEQDNELDARLQLEADGILTWAVDGYRGYLERGLDEPASIREATDAYRRNSDAIGRFIAEKCHLGAMFRATTGALYAAWQRWQESDGCDPIGRGAFGNALDSRGYPAAKPVHGKRWRNGIGLSEEVSADDE